MTASNYTDLLAGALIAAFGAILVMVWDYYKMYKDTIDRDTKILNAIEYEIGTNLYFLAINLKRLALDEEGKKINKTVTQPLIPFRNEMWILARTNISKNLLEDDKIIDMSTISMLIDATNELIRSRENFRQRKHSTIDFYLEWMRTYNTDLITNINNLANQLISLQHKLDKNKITLKADEAGAYYEINEKMKPIKEFNGRIDATTEELNKKKCLIEISLRKP